MHKPLCFALALSGLCPGAGTAQSRNAYLTDPARHMVTLLTEVIMSSHVPVLAISGSVGAGKTAVLIEIHDILEQAAIAHGCVERDALGYSWPPQGRFNEAIIERNLSCVVKTFLDAGATRLAIAGVIESEGDLAVYHRCIPDADIQVCRLTADVALRRERLRIRERGAGLNWHLERTVELDRILDNARTDHFSVENGDRPLREVAAEVLSRAGWLPSTA